MIKVGHYCNSEATCNVDLYLWLYVDILATTVMAYFLNSLMGLETRSTPSIKAITSITWLRARYKKHASWRNNLIQN